MLKFLKIKVSLCSKFKKPLCTEAKICLLMSFMSPIMQPYRKLCYYAKRFSKKFPF